MVEEENKILRRFLWLNHGHTGLYGDDGEMQCNIHPACDFKRGSIESIIRHLTKTPEQIAKEWGELNIHETIHRKI